MQEDFRRRFNSSMTYEEYVDTYVSSPKSPVIRAKERLSDYIPEISLDSPLNQNKKFISILKQIYQSKLYPTTQIDEELSEATQLDQNTLAEQFLTPVKTSDPGMLLLRARSKSENIHFTCLSFMEKRILRKMQEGKLEDKPQKCS